MKIHRRFAVFGSRFLFFALAPWLLICIPLFPYMAYTFDRSSSSVLLSSMASTICLVGLLVATDSWRFIRLTIGLLILVPIGYVWYFCLVFFADRIPFSASFRISQSTPFNAFMGLLIWGVPAVLGARRLIKKAKRISAAEAKLHQRRPQSS